MKLWQAGCGVTALGIVATVGSCGLFGLSLHRQMEQRQILIRDLDLTETPATIQIPVDEAGSRVRLDFVATVAPSAADFADADSSATIISAQLGYEYIVLTETGDTVERGAGVLTGSEIIPATDQRAGSPLGHEITLRASSSPFGVDGPATLSVELDLAREDHAGRPLVRAQVLAFDRVGTGVKGLAAGGLLSMILGPMIAGGGLLLLLAGVVFGKKKSTLTGR